MKLNQQLTIGTLVPKILFLGLKSIERIEAEYYCESFKNICLSRAIRPDNRCKVAVSREADFQTVWINGSKVLDDKPRKLQRVTSALVSSSADGVSLKAARGPSLRLREIG
jgi:hypothetical protein